MSESFYAFDQQNYQYANTYDQHHPTSPSSQPPLPPPKPGPQAPLRTSSLSVAVHPQVHNVQQTQQAPPVPPSPVHTQSIDTQQQSIQFQQQLSFPFAPPTDSGWLPPGVQDKSTADLQSLLHNAQLLSAFARRHPAYDASTHELQTAVTANLKMAERVAQLEAQVKQMRDQTGQLLLNHTSLQTQWRRKQTEMDDALSPWGPRALYQRLVSSIAEQEQLLRAVHESFLEGSSDGGEFYGTSQNGKAGEKEVTDWIKRIRDGTTTLEKRREMRARWDEGRISGWR